MDSILMFALSDVLKAFGDKMLDLELAVQAHEDDEVEKGQEEELSDYDTGYEEGFSAAVTEMEDEEEEVAVEDMTPQEAYDAGYEDGFEAKKEE